MGSEFTAVDFVYPGKFKRWEIGGHVKNSYWTEEKGIMATKWLIEEKLKWTPCDVKEELNKHIFVDNDLYGMLQRCFNSSPFEAINKTYPGVYKGWELSKVPMDFWNKNSATDAIIWLIDEKLKTKDLKLINEQILLENGLATIYSKYRQTGLIRLYQEGKKNN